MNNINERIDKVSDILLGLEPEEHPLKYHCRFCLKNTKGLPYTTLFTSAGLNHFLREKIGKCIDVKLLKNDKEIANRICITCSKHLDRAYRFAVRYEDSQKKLEEIVNVINEKLSKSRYSPSFKTDVNYNEQDADNNSEILDNVEKNTVYDEEKYLHKKKGIYIPSQIRKPIYGHDHLYGCDECSCVFKDKKEINMHLKKHSISTNQKEFQNYLDGLDAESIDDIISKIVSGSAVNGANLEEPFFNQCQLCPAVLATKAQLNKHIQQHCGTDNADVCETRQIEKLFSNEIDNVQPSEHSPELSSKNLMFCNICEKKFLSSKRFDTHIKKHFNSQLPKTKEKPNRIFQCNDCDKVFNSKVSIRKHVIVHLSKTKKQLYACNICGKEYISLVARESHKLKHDPYYEFSCEFCPKRFKLKKLLKEHIRLHTRKSNCSQKPNYICVICDIKFTSIEDLEFHKEMTHKNNLDCGLSNEVFEKYTDFVQDTLNSPDDLMKIEIEDKEYNGHLASEDFKDIEDDIMKVETEDLNSDDMEALNMDSFCEELYLSNEEVKTC